MYGDDLGERAVRVVRQLTLKAPEMLLNSHKVPKEKLKYTGTAIFVFVKPKLHSQHLKVLSLHLLTE